MSKGRIAGVFVALASVLAAGLAVGHPLWSFRELDPVPGDAAPDLPGLGVFELQLVLDDGSAEGAFGAAGAAARQFLWFQRSSPAADDFDLEEIWVLFPEDPEIAPGAAIQLVAYQDVDGDPTDGAALLLALDEVVQAADGSTFSIYSLPAAVEFRGGGDLLIGVVNRFVVSGQTPVTQPAALDSTSSQGRSWVATWSGDPPDPPVLPPDGSLFLIDDLQPGNWMVRGFGTPMPVVSVPVLSAWGVASLILLIGCVGAWALRRDLALR